MNERCNCENSGCRICHGKGCHNEVGSEGPLVHRVMYIGNVCTGCASEYPAKYRLPPVKKEEEFVTEFDHPTMGRVVIKKEK